MTVKHKLHLTLSLVYLVTVEADGMKIWKESLYEFFRRQEAPKKIYLVLKLCTAVLPDMTELMLCLLCHAV